MSSPTQQAQGGTAESLAEPRGPGLTALEGAVLSVLLALAGTTLTGYRFGDSNHGITIPILKRLMDPSLYPGDVMVATADKFPTLFYRLLAVILPGPAWIPSAFFALYVLAIAATLAGAYRIGRWAGGGAVSGVVALLFALPVRIDLAGEALYRVEFSHSHLASALTIWAMVWFLEGRRLLPLLVLSLGAYNHVLYSAYVLVPMTLVVLWESRAAGWKRTLQLLAAAVVPLLPLAAWSIAHATPMTPEWLALLRLRSSHHSFPGSFGHDLPTAAALLALASLTLSRLPEDRRRLVALFAVGIALQFVFGTVFTEYLPVKAVLQYQPHRSWRFLALLLRGVVAAGVVAGYRAGGLARWTALLTGLVVFTPGLEPFLPVVLLLQAAAGRPRPADWAKAVAVGVIFGVVGWGETEPSWGFLPELLRRATNFAPLAAGALALVVAWGLGQGRARRRLAGGVALLATVLWLGPTIYGGLAPNWETGPWRQVQDWVRENTPKTAVILTPPLETGFRVFSDRTIVGEWKDGTQQYFDDAFVREWERRMQDLRGRDYENLSDQELITLARRYAASYVVIQARRRGREGLPKLFGNNSYSVFLARPLRTGP